jgi:hypothetical protein
MTMNEHVAALLVPHRPTSSSVLAMFCGRTMDEVSDWAASPDVMTDGLPRALCHEAVLDRAETMVDDPLLALGITEMLSVLVPLAHDVAQIDLAISMTADWLRRLKTDRLLERIVEAKTEAHADDLRGRDRSLMSPEDRALLDERLEELEEIEADATLVVSLGGHDVMFMVEETCIMTLGQVEPESEEFLVLYSFDHVIDDGDEWGGDDGDPVPTPDAPTLLAA